MTKIKICGLSRIEDIDYVNEALPDYIGFVFAKSKRQIDNEQAKLLKGILDPSIQAVGVFVNEPIDNIILLCSNSSIDIVQLHGDEDENYINQLKANIDKPIIKAARIRNKDDIKASENFDTDYLLLDAYKEGEYGGSGDAFDWSIISEIGKPYFLAGGIHSGNVIDAVTKIRPYAIDISSGVESNGRKDRDKILEIITKVRSVG